MKAVWFPESLEDFFDLRQRHPAARVMAGGTDLLVHMHKGAADARPTIGLERLAELRGILTQPDGGLVLGAATPLAAIVDHSLVAETCPLLARAAVTVGGPAIRNMATIGGNICTASPAGDTLPPLYVLGARLELVSANGRRTVSIADFITGPGQITLAPGELLTAVHIPATAGFEIQHFEKVGRRNALAIAVASLAAMIRMDPQGRVAEARFAWGSVGPCVVRCPEAEALFVGNPLCTSILEAAGEPVRRAVRPIDDIRATAAHRRTLAANLLLRIGTP